MVHSVQSAGSVLASASARKRAPAQPAAQPRRVRHPHCDLSFVTCRVDSRGKLVGDVCWFDVPEETYAPGNRTGMRAYIELLARLKRGGNDYVLFDVICAAVAALGGRPPYRGDQPSRRGAAVGFLRGLEGALGEIAPLIDVEDYRARVEARWAARDLADQARREGFVRRMAEGKARRAAERQQ
jgi:hypothetical protein